MKIQVVFPAFAVAITLAGCASNGRTFGGNSGPSPFVLIEGRRIGTLEMVVDSETEGSAKKRDSVAFDNKYLRTKPRIGYKYPGQNLAFLRIQDGDRVVKTCDEASYEYAGKQGGGWQGGGGGMHMMGPNGHMTYVPGFGGGANIEGKDTYAVKYDIECEVAGLKPGMIIEIHDGDGPFAKYRLAEPVAEAGNR